MSSADEPRPPRRARPKPIPEPTEPDVDLPPLPRPGAKKPRTSPRLPGPEFIEPTEEADAIDGPSTFRPNTSKPKPSPGKSKRSVREPQPVEGKPSLVERVIFGRVSSGHLALFCRQFGTYLDAGVDLIRALESLNKQFARTGLGPVIGRMTLAVRRGDTLSDAVIREPQAFDKQFVSMIRVAEARGGIPEVLKRMAGHYEARQRLIRQARSALIYPVIVITIAFGVGMLLTIFILPTLAGMMLEMAGGRALPMPAQVLISFNYFMVKVGWWAVPMGLFGGTFGLIWFHRTPAGKSIMDSIAVNIPVLGLLLRKIDTSRFCRTLSALLEAGVNIGDSLQLTAEVLGTTPYQNAIRNARTAVMEGTELSEALLLSRRFTPDVIAIVESGEETGKMPEVLERLADDYEEQVEMLVKNLSSLIQPILFIFLGGIVLFIALAFIMTYVSLLSGLM